MHVLYTTLDRKKYENGFEIKSPLTEEAIFVAPTDLMTEPRLRKSGSKDGGLNLSSRLSSSSSTSLPDWSNSSIATVSGRDVTNMATSKDDPARSRIKPSDFHEKYVAGNIRMRVIQGHHYHTDLFIYFTFSPYLYIYF